MKTKLADTKARYKKKIQEYSAYVNQLQLAI